MSRRRKLFQFCLSTVLTALLVIACSSRNLQVTSHNGDIRINVELRQGRPYYSVIAAGETVIEPSPLGLKFQNASPLTDDLRVTDTEWNAVDRTWNPVWGTDSTIRNRYKELVVSLEETAPPNRRLDLLFRAYDDGIAFRYRLPEQPNLGDFNLTSEETYFRFAEDYNSWWIPANFDSYERTYRNTPISEIAGRDFDRKATAWEDLKFAEYTEPHAVNTPITMESPDQSRYLSVHEAALTDYAGMTLKAQSDRPLTFKSHLVPWPDGVKVKASTPHVSPWRMVQIADTPGELIESHLMLNLNEPSRIEDTSWIEPMKYIGIWWGMHLGKFSWAAGENHGATTDRAKRYMDFAAEHGIDAVLVEGWNTGWESWGQKDAFDFTEPYPDFDLEAVAEYGRSKGVALMGHHETGGDVVSYERQMQEAFQLYGDLGVPAVKTGYAGPIRPEGQHHHGQFMVNHYREVVKLAARHQIAINAHEPIKGTGIERTWPNMMTREGVRGMEWNASKEFPDNPPEHTLILPFTRMLAGPLDYTPGIFDLVYPEYRPESRVQTTLAQQLANLVILYSPVQMAADLPENYEGHPAFEFVERVPTDWDETRVIDGAIADYIAIARRRGESWYLGSATDAEKRTLEIPLDFLEAGRTYVAHVFEDGEESDYQNNPQAYQINRYLMTGEDLLKANLAPGGGQAVILEPATPEDLRRYTRYGNSEV
ncbi:MAG: glycoside hydrolase family 97 protein [Limnospira sp.]